MNIVITGGAGFIGSRLAKKLAGQGHAVTVLDNLSEQVHGPRAEFADELRLASRCVRADICDRNALADVIAEAESIVHFAAETGTGQSMYEVQRYERVNLQGTATLVDLLVNQRPKSLRKIIVASSRAVYGEGGYECQSHGVVYPGARTAADMSEGNFEPKCPACGRSVQMIPTREDAPFSPSSFYGLTKQVQEQMVLMFAATLGLDAFALRYQNVFGPGQSLRNSYTGILAVFSNLVRQGKTLNIFEDGMESRDFIYIDDVIDATAACLPPDIHGIHSLNVGSGVRTSVLDVANAVRGFFCSTAPIEVSGEFRSGDIRHNVADIARIKALTGFAPKWSFAEGLKKFLGWTETQSAAGFGFEQSLEELRSRGLLGVAR